MCGHTFSVRGTEAVGLSQGSPCVWLWPHPLPALCSASSTSFTRIPALGPKVQARSLEPHCCVRSRLWGQESIPASVTYNLAPQPETKTTVMYLVRPSSPETEQLMEPEAPGEADGRVVVTGLDIFQKPGLPQNMPFSLPSSA